ncbi:hypothetical protein EV363DRAFT_1304623 [Boletus edulis]|nr:hypothetical protein EV363DRAFT_1304623 [Boletus edulis]
MNVLPYTHKAENVPTKHPYAKRVPAESQTPDAGRGRQRTVEYVYLVLASVVIMPWVCAVTRAPDGPIKSLDRVEAKSDHGEEPSRCNMHITETRDVLAGYLRCL